MAKICPRCGYPNPNNLTECFKCHADLSIQAMREARTEQSRNSQQIRQNSNN